MPFINGRFYMNPAYGQAVENARAAEGTSNQHEPLLQDPNAHWVTIDGRHVLIHETQAGHPRHGTHNPRNHQQQKLSQQSARQFRGDATYYNLPGKKTASGEIFDPNKMAAAMTAEKVELGQTVIVTYTYKDHQGNTVMRTVSVTVNDRGPFAREANGEAKWPLQPAPGRVIDLTPAAFKKLAGTTKLGHIPVTVTVSHE